MHWESRYCASLEIPRRIPAAFSCPWNWDRTRGRYSRIWVYSLESDRMKARTAWRRSCSREVAWEAEMPLSESESPSEEGTSSGLNLGDRKSQQTPIYAVGSNNLALLPKSQVFSFSWFMNLNLWWLNVFECRICNKYLLLLNQHHYGTISFLFTDGCCCHQTQNKCNFKSNTEATVGKQKNISLWYLNTIKSSGLEY